MHFGKSNCFSAPSPPSSADILLLMRQHHYYYCYDDSPRCLIRNYEKGEVLVTSCCSYNNHLRLALTNLPFLHLCSFFSHLLLVKTHHEIVLLIITISFSMHQHRRRLIIGKDCAKVFIKFIILIKLTICLFQASSSRQLRRSV